MKPQKVAAPRPTIKRSAKVTYLSLDERRLHGKALREGGPREEHSGWKPAKDRRDPIDLLVETNRGRMAQLVPIRFGRMLQSPFAFFRGSALMPANLAETPKLRPRVQVCGDAHLLNFGGLATTDINDLDEILPAPWEWDLKRLAGERRHSGTSSPLVRERGKPGCNRNRAILP